MGLIKSLKKKLYKFKFSNKFKENEIINKRIIVTGSNSGIGLAFIDLLIKKNKIIGIVNKNSENLEKFNNDNLRVINLDLSRINEIQKIKNIIENFKPNILINCAAVFGNENQNIDNCNSDDFVNTFKINCIAVLELSKISINDKLEQIVNISSQMGSIFSNDSGNYYIYKTTKASLNMITKLMSFDLEKKNVIVFAVDPGNVKTKLNSGGYLDPKVSVSNILDLIQEQNKELNGCFLSLDGKQLKW